MLTVERALTQKRPVFALPGRIDQETFKGNHLLIKERKAKLIENVEDIVKTFEDCSLPLVFKEARKPLIPLEKEEEELLKKMPTQEVSVEELAMQIQCPIGRLNSLLMSLVLKKIVKNILAKFIKK